MKKTNINCNAKYNTVILGIISIACFIIFFRKSNIAIEYMKKGLQLCATSVIPSLFPFMVISELIVKSPMSYKIGKLLKYPLKAIFDIGEASGCALILGTVCGFPIGTKTAISMYDTGLITKDELERLLCFCNNPSSAFIISAVGISLFGSKQIGTLLYACLILSSLTIGIFLNIFLPKRKKAPIQYAPTSPINDDTVSVFTSSVTSSATSMLTVCAYVVFFYALVGCISDDLSSLGSPQIINSLVFGLFEMTSGISTAANLKLDQSLILCAIFTAWSGLSVHCQILTICSGRGLSFKKYFACKAIQGIICALYMGLALKFITTDIFASTEDVFLHHDGFSITVSPTLSCLSFFFLSILGVLMGRKSNIIKTFHESNKKQQKNLNFFQKRLDK